MKDINITVIRLGYLGFPQYYRFERDPRVQLLCHSRAHTGGQNNNPYVVRSECSVKI